MPIPFFFYLFLLLTAYSGSFASEGPSQPSKAPFHVLYSNDTTNIVSCASPWHKKGEPFRPEMLAASVDEAADAGADAEFLQPGLMWVPLWKSTVYPADEHFRWWQDTFKSPIDSIGKYMLNGGDVLRVFVDRCREKKVATFVSVRVNDYHMVEFLDAPAGTKLPAFASLAVDRFRREHLEWRISSEATKESSVGKARDMGVMDWTHPEVRARMLAFITEICENYDIDGLELDFMRHHRLFRPGETTRDQREKIVTDFVSQVRQILDRTQKLGQHRWLCVRIPAVIGYLHDPLGINVVKLSHAGVDMFNLSMSYFTIQQDLDIRAIRKLVPDKAIYAEMTHTSVVGADTSQQHGDSAFYRRTTDEQFYTTAYMAYAAGLDGLSLFNFAYYREYGRPSNPGPFFEPPFHVISRLADKQWLASASQHYFLAPVWRSPYGNPIQLPKTLSKGGSVTLHLDMIPPKGGWSGAGKLRIQFEKPLLKTCVEAQINGLKLAPTGDVSEPYSAPYPQFLGTSETLCAWVVPAKVLQAGANVIELTADGAFSSQAKVIFVDFAIKDGGLRAGAGNP